MLSRLLSAHGPSDAPGLRELCRNRARGTASKALDWVLPPGPTRGLKRRRAPLARSQHSRAVLDAHRGEVRSAASGTTGFRQRLRATPSVLGWRFIAALTSWGAGEEEERSEMAKDRH